MKREDKQTKHFCDRLDFSEYVQGSYGTSDALIIGSGKMLLPSIIGIPDRLCLLPGGVVIFVELKAPRQKPRPIQVKRHEQLRRLGFRVEVIDSKNEVDEMIRAWGGDG